MAEAGWVRVAAAADVAEGQVLGVRVGEREIALYHLPDGDYRARTKRRSSRTAGWRRAASSVRSTRRGST
jgi:hypothetical protein